MHISEASIPPSSQAETLLTQAQRLKGLLTNYKVCQQDNPEAWTEFQAKAYSFETTKKDKTGNKYAIIHRNRC